MTDPIGTAQELIEHARKLRTDLCEALPNGVGNTIDALADALQSRIAEVGRLTEALERIAATYEVVGSETDDGEVGEKTELSEWEMVNVARAALSLQPKP